MGEIIDLAARLSARGNRFEEELHVFEARRDPDYWAKDPLTAIELASRAEAAELGRWLERYELDLPPPKTTARHRRAAQETRRLRLELLLNDLEKREQELNARIRSNKARVMIHSLEARQQQLRDEVEALQSVPPPASEQLLEVQARLAELRSRLGEDG